MNDGTQETRVRSGRRPNAGGAVAKIEIRHRYTDKVLFAHEAEGNTIRLTVEAAVSAKVSLNWASLDGASLNYASLIGASLDGASLNYASLIGASLIGASLNDASLIGASLIGVSLIGASLNGLHMPVIAHIDAAILRAIETSGNALDMSDWHTCETTHCRAGWAIMLAGDAGRELEKAIGPSAAGALIYAASRPTKRVPDFIASDEDALADLRACAAADPLPAEAI